MDYQIFSFVIIVFYFLRPCFFSKNEMEYRFIIFRLDGFDAIAFGILCLSIGCLSNNDCLAFIVDGSFSYMTISFLLLVLLL